MAKLQVKPGICAFLLLVAFALLIRFPYFSVIRVSWDEWTYILIGQDMLNGNLLYSNLWDIKPPLAFSAYALFIAIFGTCIEGIRISGAIVLGVTSFFVFLVARRFLPLSFAVPAGMLCALLASLRPFQATLTEHLALLPLVVALWLMTSRPVGVKVLFCAGIFVAAAAFTRTNLMFVALVLGLYLLISKMIRHQSFVGLKHAASFSLGFLTVFVCTVLPYVTRHEIGLYFRSVFLAPLAYSAAKMSAIEVLAFQVKRSFEMLLMPSRFLFALGYLGAVVGVLLFLISRPSDREKEGAWVFLMFAAAVEFSILKSGRAFDHYLIQLAPFLAVLSVYAVWSLGQRSPRSLKWATSTPCLLAVLAACGASGFVSAGGEQKTNRKLAELIEFLEAEVSAEDRLMMTNEHIAYWFLDKEPIRPSMTHPSNISKPFLLANIPGAADETVAELEIVLQQESEYIVTRKKVWYLPHESEAHRLFEGTVSRDYTLLKRIGSALIYRRNDCLARRN